MMLVEVGQNLVKARQAHLVQSPLTLYNYEYIQSQTSHVQRHTFLYVYLCNMNRLELK